jgi:hypothetical protein
LSADTSEMQDCPEKSYGIVSHMEYLEKASLVKSVATNTEISIDSSLYCGPHVVDHTNSHISKIDNELPKHYGQLFVQNNDVANKKTNEIIQKHNEHIEFKCIDSFRSPLISDDIKGTTGSIHKLRSVLEKLQTVDEKTRKKTLIALDRLRDSLETGKNVPTNLLPRLCSFLRQSLEHKHATVHALLLIRIIMLQSPPSITASCYDWITSELISPQSDETSTPRLMELPVARSLGWLVACNALANTTSANDFRLMVQAANTDINNPEAPVQLRQAAGAFLYNASLHRQFYWLRKSTIEQDRFRMSHVAMVHACLAGLPDETDSTTRLRRLMILSRILRPKDKRVSGEVTLNESALVLFESLGAKEIFSSVLLRLNNSTEDSNDDEICRKAVFEFIQIMDERQHSVLV